MSPHTLRQLLALIAITVSAGPVSAQVFNLAPPSARSLTKPEFEARLSTNEAVVGVPVTLELSLKNVSDYSLPELPSIDGLEILRSGAPSKSVYQMTVNGRESTSVNITFRYSVTSSRVGTFDIPPIKAKAGTNVFSSSPLQLIVRDGTETDSQGENGKLVFVEIDGKQDKVYVGQPLELTLRLWIQSFEDKSRRVRLNEASLWGRISDHTRWGSFEKAIRDLADQNQRPGGEQVTRDNGSGQTKTYFLYEIDATVYPKKPGVIDASDVRVVVDYPVELGRSRDRMSDFFGGNSSMGSFFDDDFFRSSFGNRLTITKSQTLVATAEVDETKVLAIPTAGRPDNYQGAVGRYEISTRVDRKKVKSGDPIRLQISISGDGPLDLVQPPKLENLAQQFQVEDESLAGFVRDGVKYFTTTIQPRETTTTEVPPISMSFFDPSTEKFETIASEPIAIEVEPADKLDMTSIVSGDETTAASPPASVQADRAIDEIGTLATQFFGTESPSNLPSIQSLASVQPRRSADAWWWWIGCGSIASCVLIHCFARRRQLAVIVSGLRSPLKVANGQIQHAVDGRGIATAFASYFGQKDLAGACGHLRQDGHYQLAAQAESLLSRADRDQSFNDEAIETLRRDTHSLLSQVDQERKRSPFFGRRQVLSNASKTAMIMLATCAFTMNSVIANEGSVKEQLSPEQWLQKGHAAYHAAMRDNPSEESRRSQLAIATASYQRVIDAGIQNAELFEMVGDAHHDNNDLGRAIANYRKALLHSPYDWSVWQSLFAAKLKAGEPNLAVVNPVVLLAIFAIASASLVVTTCLRVYTKADMTTRRRFPIGLVGSVTLMATTLGWYALHHDTYAPRSEAIVVAQELIVREGDGNQFDEVARIDSAEGKRLKRLHARGNWVQIRMEDQQVGWVSNKSVLLVD